MHNFPQAIFFDFDGVLVESADIKTDAFVELFKNYPRHQEAIRQHHLKNMGVSRFKKFEWIHRELLGRTVEPGELQQLGHDFSQLVLEKILKAPEVDGATSLLMTLHGKCLTFVASGTPEDELNYTVEARNWSGHFHEVCGTPRTKTQIVEALLNQYKLTPSQCWFIGDANTDFEAARNTGLHFIARNSKAMQSFWRAQSNIDVVESMNDVLRMLSHEH